MPDDDEVLQHVIDAELRLHSQAVRRTRAEVERLLHPEFVEFGSSGRRWTRDAMLAAIGTELTDETAIVAHDVHAARLAEDVVLVTYVSDHGGRLSRRSSVWCDTVGGWRIRFHQGSLVSDASRKDRR